MAQQDDYYYEIQLTNKQLVFYFLAGATGLILSFLAGVMVGRGVDPSNGEVQARTVQEDRVVTEEAPSPAPSSDSYSYARRLEGDKIEEKLEKPVDVASNAGGTGDAKPRVLPSAAPAAPAVTTPDKPSPKPSATPTPKPSPSAKPAEAVGPPVPTKPAVDPSRAGKFTIQVGAFKDKASAETVAGRLKGKGYQAYVLPSDAADGLFNVRVGNFAARPDAEKVSSKLKDAEKFKPFIVKQ